MNSSTDRRARTHTAEPLPAPAEGHPPAGRAIGPMSTLVEPDATQTWAAGAAIVWMAAAASGNHPRPLLSWRHPTKLISFVRAVRDSDHECTAQ